MSLTLLLDLDDTLLTNNIDGFLPAYLQALSTRLASYAEPQVLVTQLLAATRAMIENRRPDRTLKQVFDENFYPKLGLDADAMREPLDAFYAQVFPGLQGLTQPRPEAIALVEEALRRGYQIAIATNPLFPRAAIEHRLAWAGLSPQRIPFRIISSYETFHFTKPQPAYYAELLARMGWPDGAVIMVGDDLERDISATRSLGIQAFWIPKEPAASVNGSLGPNGSGSLADILPWVDAQPEEALKPNYTLPSAMLATLRSTPAAIDSLCMGLSKEAWLRRPAPQEWCATEVMCHLRDVDREVNLPRIQTILKEINPFISGKDTDPWAEERGYICQSGEEAFREFTATRLELLDLLEGLPPEGWQRPARHAIFGPTTLAELVSINAGHDRLHIQQVIQNLQTI